MHVYKKVMAVLMNKQLSNDLIIMYVGEWWLKSLKSPVQVYCIKACYTGRLISPVAQHSVAIATLWFFCYLFHNGQPQPGPPSPLLSVHSYILGNTHTHHVFEPSSW